jgi:phosphatidylglycerol:prolipoprotein diacylglycerol transferase
MSFAPQIPYLQIPELVLIPADAFKDGLPSGPISVKPFGTLVALGVYLGAYLAIRHGKRRKLDERVLTSFIFWVVGVAFVCGHVLDLVFYYPERLMKDPWALVRLWDGLSSFGGFIGAILGGFLWKWRYKANMLPYADVVASAFPVGWLFGRMGCSLAHDHPGVRSELWIAVQYPDGGRFDLGLYEMLLTLPLAIAFLYLQKQPRRWGFYAGSMCMLYAPVRFFLDFLREYTPDRDAHVGVGVVDPRYGPFTPAQWACFALFAFGAGLWIYSRRQGTALEPMANVTPGYAALPKVRAP